MTRSVEGNVLESEFTLMCIFPYRIHNMYVLFIVVVTNLAHNKITTLHVKYFTNFGYNRMSINKTTMNPIPNKDFYLTSI